MSIFESHYTGPVITEDGDNFHEQWVSGTYIVAGVFIRRCSCLSISQIGEEIPHLFELLCINKQAWWPRGICAYYAIPIYTSNEFDPATVDWVHTRPEYKYAMWHEPVLYDRKRNTAEIYLAEGLCRLAFRVFLREVIYGALRAVSQREGYSDFPAVNRQC
jgi:hypothetical protein